MPGRPSFRNLLTADKPLVLPCAHDALSARLIESAGFAAMGISGLSAIAARYALPDLGIVGFADMSAITRDILGATSITCMCDADDGYGDVKAVARTVSVYEALGVGALVLEDQERSSKRPGQSAASGVVSNEEITAKLRVALETRTDRDFWIIGRTDAYGSHGIEYALRRSEMYLQIGVDGLFVAGVRKPEDLERIGRSFRGTALTAVMSVGQGWPVLSISELHGMGYTQILYPLALLLPMCTLFDDILKSLRDAAANGATPLAGAEEQRARSILATAVNTERWLSLEARLQPTAAESGQHGAPA